MEVGRPESPHHPGVLVDSQQIIAMALKKRLENITRTRYESASPGSFVRAVAGGVQLPVE
jgi:hypothetical protein